MSSKKQHPVISYFVRHRNVLLPFILIFVVGLLYMPILQHGFISLDDDRLIFENPLVRDLSVQAFVSAFFSFTLQLYIPITIVSLQINALMGGVQPGIYHATDILLHAFNVFLVYRIFHTLTRHKIGSFFGALLFAVHPMNVEAIAWASSRKDLLPATFALLSVRFYLQYLEEGISFLWSVAMFIVGVFSKVSIVTLPFVLILLDYAKGRRLDKAMIREKLWFIVPACFIAAISLLGGKQVTTGLDPITLVALGARATVHYVLLFLWPTNLSASTYVHEPLQLANVAFIGSIIVFLLFWLVFGMLLVRRKEHPLTLCIGWFLLLVLPSFAAIQKGGLLYYGSDKYAYLPSVGLALLVSIITAYVWEKWTRMRIATLMICFCIIASLIVKTVRQIPVWRSSETLYTYVLRHSPNDPLALTNLAQLRYEEGKIDEALALYTYMFTHEPEVLIAHTNAAMIHLERGEEAEALAIYRALPDVLPVRTVRADSRVRSLIIRTSDQILALGDRDGADHLLQSALSISPSSTDLQKALKALNTSPL